MSRARFLRRNSTDAEQKLWALLRNRALNQFKFRRQQTIGPYIVDFICFERRLIIELDGGQHSENVTKDAVRTGWLERQGFRVIRFWNNEMLTNSDGVAATIERALAHPSPGR